MNSKIILIAMAFIMIASPALADSMGVIDDSYVTNASVNAINGNLTYIRYENYTYWDNSFHHDEIIYLKLNTSLLQYGKEVVDADLCMLWITIGKEHADYMSGNDTWRFYEVYDNSWSENSLNWNNQPCGFSFDNSTACNFTPFATYQLNYWRLNSGNADYLYHCVDMTSLLASHYGSEDDIISVAIANSPLEVETGEFIYFASKENGNANYRPLVNVTFENCTEGLMRCVGSGQEVCVGGTWMLNQTCTEGCDDSEGICFECTGDESACIGDNVSACVDGYFEYVSGCDYGCNDELVECYECSNGTYECDGSTLNLCTAGYFGFDSLCNFGCEANACLQCVYNSTICWEDGNAGVCDGLDWLNVTCEFGCSDRGGVHCMNSFEGMTTSIGTGTGSFLSQITMPFANFILLLGVIAGILGIVYGIAFTIRSVLK